MNLRLINDDCKKAMSGMTEGCVGSIICDPPYGLEFMGKEFDKLGEGEAQREWHLEWLTEAHRVLRPCGVIKAFGGTRTYHHLAAAMEDAGFIDIRLEAWAYGSGFPKSHNVSRAIHAAITTGGSAPKNFRKARMGDSYEPTGQKDYRKGRMFSAEIEQDKPSTVLCEEAVPYEGWGTALKPAWEPIVVGRKPNA
jgi:DNA modification methylase